MKEGQEGARELSCVTLGTKETHSNHGHARAAQRCVKRALTLLERVIAAAARARVLSGAGRNAFTLPVARVRRGCRIDRERVRIVAARKRDGAH